MHVAVDCQLNTSGKTADKSDFQINIVYCIRDVLVRLYLFALRSLNPLWNVLCWAYPVSGFRQ